MSQRRPVSKRIRTLYRNYYTEKAEQRFSFFMDFAHKYCDGLEIPDYLVYSINSVKMRAVVKSYFLDVIKYKEYHFNPKFDFAIEKLNTKEWDDSVHIENKINRSKIAAFTAKWMMKHSPIQILSTDDNKVVFEDEYLINSIMAKFTLNICFELLQVETESVEKEIVGRLLYHLKYRMIDDRALFGWFQAIQERRRNKNMAKSYSVFVASPKDCDILRESSKKIMDKINHEYSINGGAPKLNYFMWDEHKKVGATTKYQDDIFAEAKDKWKSETCDVLMVYTWYRYGTGTIVEFEEFLPPMVDDKSKLPIFCKYAADFPNTKDAKKDLAKIDDLENWVKSVEDILAPLGRKRDAIADIATFEAELETELRRYINRMDNE